MDDFTGPTIKIMPTSFGVAGGPRQAPGGAEFRPVPVAVKRYIVRFLGNSDQLAQLLPSGLALRGEPIVQVQYFCFTEVPWLAGRGYNLLSIQLPVHHTSSSSESLDALYHAVMWENLGDPIITGREQLGNPKLYAQLSTPTNCNGTTRIRASWDHFTFAELELYCNEAPDPEQVAELVAAGGAGIISHKYIPTTGQWDRADADYFTFSAIPSASERRDPQPAPTVKIGKGRVKFNRPEWQDMPTQYHIVQHLADLEQREVLDAFITEGKMHIDFFDQVILS